MEYEPGVCNIGPAERRKRLALAGGSLAAAVVLTAVVVVEGLPVWTLLFTMFPLYGAAMGWLQARENFCIGFAAMGRYDVGDGQYEVTNQSAREADQNRAIRLNAKALVVGGAATLAVYLLGLTLL